MQEDGFAHLIATVSPVWDNVSMNGEMAAYVTVVRKKGNDWYVVSMTGWDARDLYIGLSFLGGGVFKAEIFRDGVNADRAAYNYVKEIINIPVNKKLKILMVSAGGYVMRICKMI